MLIAERVRLSFRDAGEGWLQILDLPRLAPSPGSLTAIRGPSGSGKSTLLYVLGGLLPPQGGSVRWNGTDIYGMRESRRDVLRRRHVGFVFQDFHLLPEMTPLANVCVPATFGTRLAGAAARARFLLERLAVPADRRSVEEMSRGERQRVAIARALLFDPPLIIADEPTASLDDAAAAAVLGILRELAADGRTVVAASHDREVIAAATVEIALKQARAADAAPRAAA